MIDEKREVLDEYGTTSDRWYILSLLLGDMVAKINDRGGGGGGGVVAVIIHRSIDPCSSSNDDEEDEEEEDPQLLVQELLSKYLPLSLL